MPRVFISHTGTDDRFVTELAGRLRAEGLEYWADHLGGGMPGQNIYDNVQDALYYCDMTLVVLSNVSARNHNVQGECQHTLALGKRVYPVVIEEIPDKDFPWFLRPILYVDLTRDYASGFKNLTAAMLGDRRLDLRSEFVSVKRRLSVLSKVNPNLLVRMCGREDDLSKVVTYLREASPTFITGAGGLGKSRLAYEIALRAQGFDGVIWHECSDATSQTQVYNLVASHLDLPECVPKVQVLKRLASHKLLVVFDDAHKVKEDARRREYIELVSLLRQNGAYILLTGREMWDDFNGAMRFTPVELSSDTATEVCRAICEHYKVELTEAELTDVAAKAFKHPGMIDWAIAFSTHTPLNVILDQLETLKGRRIEDALEEFIRLNLRQMETRNKPYGSMAVRALRRLNICRGGFTRQAAEHLVIDRSDPALPNDEDDVTEVLYLLQHWPFVRYASDGRRYAIDEFVIVAVGEDESAYMAHSEFYSTVAVLNGPNWRYSALVPDIDNYYIAFIRCLELGELHMAHEIYVPLSIGLLQFGVVDEWRQWFKLLKREVKKRNVDDLKGPMAFHEADLNLMAPVGRPVDSFKSSIKWNRIAMRAYPRETHPVRHARALLNIGYAYVEIANIENSVENLNTAGEWLENAIACFCEVKEISIEIAFMVSRARIQLMRARTGDEPSAQSVEAVYSAIEERVTKRDEPFWFMLMQHDLGMNYVSVAYAERSVEIMEKGLESFAQALDLLCPREFPTIRIRVENELSRAFFFLSKYEDDVDNVIGFFRASNRYLGSFIGKRKSRDRALALKRRGDMFFIWDNLKEAIRCWQEAIDCFRMVDQSEDCDILESRIARLQEAIPHML